MPGRPALTAFSVQVFSFEPGDSYCQGCTNTFSILGSTGSNGLRPIVQQASGGIYAGVIINQWLATGTMNQPRTSFAWVETPNGTALAVGGINSNAQITGTADEYNATTQTWSLTKNNLPSPVALSSVRASSAASSSPRAMLGWACLTTQHCITAVCP